MAPGEIPEIDEESSVYEFRGLLGKGSFNKVFKALHKQTNEEIAVKVGASVYQTFVSRCLKMGTRRVLSSGSWLKLR